MAVKYQPTHQIKYFLLLLLLSLLLSLLSRLCWCSFCASAERKPCTWSISHSSQSFCSHTRNFSQDWRISQHADLLNLCHSGCFWYFLDVFHHPFLYCTKRTNNYRDHYGSCHILCISRSLYWLFFSISFSVMFLSDGTVLLIIVIIIIITMKVFSEH